MDMDSTMDRTRSAMPLAAGTRLGPYEIVGALGSGGMGEVYRAHDRRLDRDVAVKIISAELASDARILARFEREAKAVAALSHPNILSIFDFSKDDQICYAVTELLEGQTLRSHLTEGPLPWRKAVEITAQITAGLAGAHQRGIVHRDLKPENVFLTRDGRVKILDFGLAAIQVGLTPEDATVPFLTRPGDAMGTCGYMSPEQISGWDVDHRSDIFSFGCILYECLAGHRPFGGKTMGEVLAATLRDQPPEIEIADLPEVLDSLLFRCLDKNPRNRFQSAADLDNALRQILRSEDSRGQKRSRSAPPSTRVIVLPFRMLRPDPQIDFLAYSLPDAITSSLGVVTSLVVRSSIAASRYGADVSDIARIAQEQDVNAILSGSILAAGDRLRVTTQLTEAPGGRLVWSHSSETSLQDIFVLQDELTHKVVQSLSVPVSDGESRQLRRDVPRSALAYEFYLRGNQQGHGPEQWMMARELYQQSLREDPQFAPSWARLGRTHWLIAKYTSEPGDHWGEAEKALQRAIEINPDLNLAHRLYAELDLDLGRTTSALQRIIARIRARQSDSELYTALVKILRYCGLLDESLAAHEQAIKLDPRANTSVTHTYFMRGDYEKALVSSDRDIGYIGPLSLIMMDRREEADRRVKARLAEITDPQLRAYLLSLASTYLHGNREEALRLADVALSRFRDPEAIFYLAVRTFGFLEDTDRALSALEKIVNGYFIVDRFRTDPWLDSLRASPRFEAILRRADTRHAEARKIWNESGLLRSRSVV